MADAYIQLPVDGIGKKLDADQLTVGTETVYRERDRIAGDSAAELADVRNSDAAPTDFGLAVRPIDVVSPATQCLSSANLAAGSAVDLDCTAIANGKTGKLLSAICASSVACKWILKKRDGIVENTIGIGFTSVLRPTLVWSPPDKRCNELAYVSGDENFRITVTNLDRSNAADVYATVHWDEV